MSLIIINDPIHKDYEDLFNRALQLKPTQIDVYLNSSIHSVEQLGRVLNKLYGQVRALSLDHQYSYKFNIDILFNSIDFQDYKRIYVSDKEVHIAKSQKLNVTAIPSELKSVDAGPSEGSSVGKFDIVAVGGTFDHLHDGHKILLSSAVFLAKNKVIVGITDDELLKNKKYKQYLELFEKRLEITTKFLKKIASNQTFDLYKIVDICGPTGYIKGIDCLVLSKESASGGEFVNNFRKSIGYPKLTVYAIELIGGENKLSSTDLRREEQELTQFQQK
ncbi:phosphopantetheine adenylyltransferase [Yamadazyma tenuis]|uniref:phosphopantetheine adenylyltransferase n=1 Tax=Candida tenuis TaxID=2315449 RepID=UPI0027A2806E|nr:phosphopantetheine adenylyltransferase [Yamadazyma tenuis]